MVCRQKYNRPRREPRAEESRSPCGPVFVRRSVCRAARGELLGRRLSVWLAAPWPIVRYEAKDRVAAIRSGLRRGGDECLPGVHPWTAGYGRRVPGIDPW